MPIYPVYAPRWDKSDLEGLAKNQPLPASVGDATLSFDFDMSQVSSEHWGEFVTAYRKLLTFVPANAHSTDFTLSVSIPHNPEEGTFRDRPTLASIGARLQCIKAVDDMIAPCPACWDWTIALRFEKLPSSKLLTKTLRQVERAVWGRPLTEEIEK